MRLHDLPRDEFIKVLGYLDAADIVHLALSCRAIYETLQDDEVWHFLCDITWSKDTSVLQWVTNVPRNAPSSLPRPGSTSEFETLSRADITTFKDAYIVLNHIRHLSGLWRIIGEGKEAGVVSIEWKSDGLIASHLDFVSGSGKPRLREFHAVKPSRDILNSIEWDSKFDVVALRVDTLPSSYGGPVDIGRQSPSFATPVHHRSSEVADVGFGTPRSFSSRDSPLYGSSPESSFRQAWGQFMSSSVQRRSKSMRRRQAAGGFLNLRHLQRLYMDTPDEKHPLSGLWSAELEDGAIDLVDFSYTNSKHIIVTKVSGPGCLSPGNTIFKLKTNLISQLTPGDLQYHMEMLDLEGLSDAEFTDQDLSFYEGASTYFGTDDPDILHQDLDARVEDSDIDEGDDVFKCKLFPYTDQLMALVIADTLLVNLRRLQIP
ncbi:hypothetical protein M9435_003504 [Picochlorum sp. BPE23]|nr:hypothetical protein M9435_003504 [Picochlorum sp. BPE23]